MAMNSDYVCVREVGLRDGLQRITVPFPTEAKIEWLRIEAAAGISSIEVCSFASSKVMPQFADRAEVIAAARAIPALEVCATILNYRRAEEAFTADVDALNFVISASDTHNMQNVRRTPEQSMDEFKQVVALRSSRDQWRRIKLAGCIATAFGCTLEGSVDPRRVLSIAEQYIEAGADEVALADTVGFASPKHVKTLFTDLLALTGSLQVSAHIHDTRGLGLANVYAALEVGVRRFDGSLGGLGGCPFAPGASGNIVTEDLVFMLEGCGFETGVDVEKLLPLRDLISRHLPDEDLHGAFARAGPCRVLVE